MATQIDNIVRRHGKPFNYFELGKGFTEGADFMRHMKTAAEEVMAKAIESGATRQVQACPVCGNAETRVAFEAFAHPYSQCSHEDCRHAFVSTMADEELRNAFFREDEEYSRRNYCDPGKSAFRLENIARPKVQHILEFAPGGASRWLDVGCGSGEILAALSERSGWTAVGLELSQRDAAFGREHFEVDIREQLLDAFGGQNPGSRFDVVSLFGVLHCIEDPVTFARQAAEMVAPGGIFVAEAANFESVLTEAVRSYPEHPTRSSYNGITTLHQFTEASIRRTFRTAGLEPISVWYYGTDVFEVINQWCFSDPGFPESPLSESLSALANDIQSAIDHREQSSNMLWIARMPSQSPRQGGR